MQRKRMLVAMLAAVLTGGVIGCSSGKGTDAPPTGSPAAATPALYEKNLEITWMGDGARGKIEDNNWVQQKIEGMFNVKLLNRKVNNQDANAIALMFASDQTPEAFFIARAPLDLYNEGLIRTIPKELIVKYAPNYAKMLDMEPSGWRLNLAPGKTDEFMSLTGYSGNTKGLLWAPTFRLDWLEKLGIKPPGEIKPIGDEGGRERIYFTDKAYTLQEVENILLAFAKNDPDGNGKNDTYGISMNNNAWSSWANTLMGAYGIADGYNIEENGKVTAVEISKPYKEFLKLMAKWYKMGIVDPEFTTLNLQKHWEKYSLGKIGYDIAQPSYIGLDDLYKTRSPQNLVIKDPNVKLLVTAPEIGPDGKQGVKANTPVNVFAGNFYVRKGVSDEKLIRILQIFDYLNFDKDAARWSRYGEEGVHFKWEGEPGKSAIKINEGLPKEEGNLGFWYYNMRVYSDNEIPYFTSATTLKLQNQFFANPASGLKMNIRPYKWDLYNETKVQELNKKYGGKLNTMVDEFRMKAITGELDIDAEWDHYVKKWLDGGGRELYDEYEKAPKVADLLK